jgi:hypothetical protein
MLQLKMMMALLKNPQSTMAQAAQLKMLQLKKTAWLMMPQTKTMAQLKTP